MSFAERARTEAGLSLSRTAVTLWDRYGDERKLANAKRLAAQRERCAIKVSALPWRIVLETHGEDNLQADAAEHFLAELWPFLVQVILSNHGDGLLNPHLPEIIARIHNRNVGTCIQSQLTHFPQELCQSAIRAGLDMVIASVEGASQEEAARFRAEGLPGGALANLARLVRLRNATPGTNLRIVWRATCYSHNTQEVQRNRDLARAIGVDELVIVDRDLHRQFKADDVLCKEPSEDLLCSSPWEFPAIHVDGTLMPCGLANDRRFAWGDLRRQPWEQAFNAPQFQQARHLSAGDSTAVSPCLGCWKMKPMRDRVSRAIPLRVLEATS